MTKVLTSFFTFQPKFHTINTMSLTNYNQNYYICGMFFEQNSL